MKNFTLYLMGLTTYLISCGQGRTGDSTSVDNKRLTCLVLGYDSIIYYIGFSNQMQEVHSGKITDTAFVAAMFEKIKSDSLSMVIKPGGGADMLGNFQEIVNLANINNVNRRSVDSGDTNEDKAFGFVTPPMVKAAMRGEDRPPLKLNLPRDEPASPNAVSNFPKASQLVILISGSTGIYAYMGGDIRTGKKYTYQELIDLVKAKRSDKDFSVVIRPAKSSTYKNTVDILDVMTISNIKNYALVDITNEEEDYLRKLYQ